MLFQAVAALILGWAAPLPLAWRLLSKRGRDASPHITHSHRTARGATRARPPLPRMACASALCLFSCLAWQVCANWMPWALLVLAGTCMLAALACDVRARILPWELCVAMLVLGCVYSLLTRTPAELLMALALAAALNTALTLLRLMAPHVGLSEPVGEGDLRFMPGLFALCGFAGSVRGALACSLVMGTWALVMLARRLLQRGTGGRHSLVSGARGRHTLAPGSCGPHAPVPAAAPAECGSTHLRERAVTANSQHHEGLPLAPGFCVWLCVGVLCA